MGRGASPARFRGRGLVASRPKREAFLLPLGLGLPIVIAASDYWTGAEIRLSVLYLAPLGLIAWFSSRRDTLLAAGACTFALFVSDLVLGRPIRGPLLLVWGASIRFGVFAVLGLLLHKLRSDLRERGRLIADLQDALAERKRAEKELAQKAQELARSCAELEEFASVAAHDLKSPLVVVGGYLQLLHRRFAAELGEEAETYLTRTLDGVNQMQALIDDLLSYARLGAGAPAQEAFDATRALELALTNLDPSVTESGALITRESLPTVSANGSELIQVFQNLIENAIKFRRPEEAPTIHVTAASQGEEWVFSVRDNGIGMDPAQADKIFRIFHRLHSGSEYPGTGIGLAICKKIVERHGGRIWVETEPGKGSTFCFSLPGAPPEEKGTEPDGIGGRS